MDVMTAIKTRRSIRAYEKREIESEKLNLVLEAGRLAPSAGNRQEWKFIVVKDAQIRSKLAAASCNQAFVGEAPAVIVAYASDVDHTMKCGQASYSIDLAIALDHMSLKATEEGLGTCWIGAFYEDEVRKILSIPGDNRIVALLPIGYPAATPSQTSRKKLEEIVEER